MNRFLFSVGLALLVFTIGSLFLLIPLLQAPLRTSGQIPLLQPVQQNTGPGGGPLPIGISASTVDPGLVVEYEWPRHMDINGSDSISVALTVARERLSPEPPIPAPIGNVSDRGKNTVIPTSLEAEEETRCPQELSGCRISNIFGSTYQLSTASAYMVTTSFDAQLMGSVERATDQPFIEWDWNILPKSAGSQIVDVGIDLQWTPTSKGGGTTIVRQLWESPITIEVDKPFIDVGQLSLSTTVSGFFGIVFTGVSLPWILQQRQQPEKRKRRFCRYCRAENPADFVFCTRCGKQQYTGETLSSHEGKSQADSTQGVKLE